MLRTKSNFSGRWMGIQCNVCALEDTDIHIFKCPGYIITDDWMRLIMKCSGRKKL